MSNPLVSFDEQAVEDELRELVRKTIEETIDAMLDEEADQLVGAGPHERTDERTVYRAGHYERGFTTTSGRVTLKMPKLKGTRFATAISERYKRRETSVEGAIIEMYLAGVSTRRIEDVGEILWSTGMPSSDLRIPAYLYRRHLPQAQLGRLLRERGGHGGDRRERGRIPRGRRLRRGLHGVQGMLARLPVVAEVARAARRSHVHRRQGRRHGRLDRRGVPRGQIPALHGALLPQRAGQGPQIEAFPGRGHAQGHPRHGVARGLGGQGRVGGSRARVDEAERGPKVVREGFAETLTYREMPREHWRRIRTNNAIERLNREIRRRTRVVGTFPDGKSALMLVAARLKYVIDGEWGLPPFIGRVSV